MVVGEGDTHMLSLAPYITQMYSPKKCYVYWTVHHLDS